MLVECAQLDRIFLPAEFRAGNLDKILSKQGVGGGVVFRIPKL